MGDYRVDLDVFAGPLDLLLYLVRKEEVDIYDIHIAKITDQYIHYIEMLKNLDIDLAGDFLVMAATLMQIKSAMLLPKAEPGDAQDDDLSDPRNVRLASSGPTVDLLVCIGGFVSNGRVFHTTNGTGLQCSAVYGEEAAGFTVPWQKK